MTLARIGTRAPGAIALASLRDDFEVSCPELDLVVDLARDMGEQGGVYGCRMTGGGFGGCTVSLVKSDCVEDIGRDIARLYKNKTGLDASLFSSRPGQGATILK